MKSTVYMLMVVAGLLPATAVVVTLATAKPDCITVRNPAPGTPKCVPLPKPRPKVEERK